MELKYQDKLIFSEKTSFNQCIIGLVQLRTLILENLHMFANFCDYPNPLRQELSFFDAFRYALNYSYRNMPSEQSMLMENDYASLSMYRIFCKANQTILGRIIPSADGNVTSTRKLLKHNTAKELYVQMIRNLVNSLR